MTGPASHSADSARHAAAGGLCRQEGELQGCFIDAYQKQRHGRSVRQFFMQEVVLVLTYITREAGDLLWQFLHNVE